MLAPNPSISIQWLHLDLPIHSTQPLNLIIAESLLSFCWCGLLEEQLEHLGLGLGRASFDKATLKKFAPHLVILLSISKSCLRKLQTSANSQPKVKKRTEGAKEQRRTDHRGNLCFSRSPWMGFLGIHCWPLFHLLSILQSAVGALAWRGSKLASFQARALQATLLS